MESKNLNEYKEDVMLVGERFVLGKQYLTEFEKVYLKSMGFKDKDLLDVNPRNVIIDKQMGVELSIRGIKKFIDEKQLVYKMYKTMYDFLVSNGYRCVYDEIKKYYDVLEIAIDNVIFKNKKDICSRFTSCLECPLFTNKPIHEVLTELKFDDIKYMKKFEDIDNEEM